MVVVVDFVVTYGNGPIVSRPSLMYALRSGVVFAVCREVLWFA